jgi:hypothetical protein
MGNITQAIEFLRGPIFPDWQMGQRRPHVLTESEPIAAYSPQIVQRLNNFGFGFPMTQH